MLPETSVSLSAFWGSRRETPAALARRWLAVVRDLQKLDPALAAWFYGVDERGVPVPLDARAVEAIIASEASDSGYRFNAKSDIAGGGPRVFELMMKGGDSWYNVVTFGTSFFHEPDPALLRYDLFRAALLAIAEVFEAGHARAYSSALMDFWAEGEASSSFPVSWLSYVGPHLAPQVTPPAGVIVERRPNGGVLIAATTDLFDTDNPAHMAAAWAIEQAVLPLSRVRPWDLPAS